MAPFLPLEVMSLIFKYLVHGLWQDNKFGDSFKLRLISKSLSTIVEPILYRKLDLVGHQIGWRCNKEAQYPGLQLQRICCTILNRPRVAAAVKEVDLDEADPLDDKRHSPSDPDELQVRYQEIEKAAELLKAGFIAENEDLDFLAEKWIEKLKIIDEPAVQWLFLAQLPNLESLGLTLRKGKHSEMAMLLRFPHLRALELTVDVGEGPWKRAFAPAELLESLISSTKRLEILEFVDMRSVYFPATADAGNLKTILDPHAPTLRHLSVVLAMNDEKDWRLPQECTDVVGSFGSMRNFTKLESLSIQFEVLLGKPSAGAHQLKDVLPTQLREMTCLTLCDYNGDDETRIWESEDYIAQFQGLAKVAEDSQSFPELQNVNTHISRRDSFRSPNRGCYTDGILERSRIEFGWY